MHNSTVMTVLLSERESVWPSGKALGWYAEGPRFDFASGCPFSSNVVVFGHCLCEPVWRSGLVS